MLSNLLGLKKPPHARHTSLTGKAIAITGPHGSTGKSTVAINMAALLVAEKRKVFLIDADVLGSSLANQLLLAELPAGLAGAIRIASQNRFDLEQLQRLSVQTAKSNITLLPGSTKLAGQENLAVELAKIVETAKANFDFVILDLPSLSFQDQDFASQLALLADEVFIVALADPVGIFRLLALQKQLQGLSLEPKLVINRVRNSVIAQAKKEITETLLRLGQLEIAGFLPEDQGQLDQALKLGVPVSASSRSSAFRQGLSLIVRTTLLGKAGLLDSRMAKLG